jgi:hypothetical protein
MPAVVIAGGIAAAGSIGGAMVGANASEKAAEGQENAISGAEAQQASLYGQTVQREAPFVQAGQTASQQLQNQGGQGGALGRQFTLADFQKSPAYNQNIQAALKAIGNSASARGGALGGRPVQDMVNYATNNAGNTFTAAQQGFQANQQLNTRALQGQIQGGIQAAGGVNQASNQYGNQVGNNAVNSGNAYAAGQIGQSKAIAGAIPTIANSLATGINAYAHPAPAPAPAPAAIGGGYDYASPYNMSPYSPQMSPSLQNFNIAGD